MKLNKADLMAKITAFIGERNDDDSISLMEDVNDSFSETTETEDWKKKHDDLDIFWRNKYKERFSSNVEEKKEVQESKEEDEINDEISIDDVLGIKGEN